jgi:acetyl esterase/lipase
MSSSFTRAQGNCRGYAERVKAGSGDVALHMWWGMPHVFYALVGMFTAAFDVLGIAGAFIRQLSQAGPSPLPNGH